jgi:hypothetical protein
LQSRGVEYGDGCLVGVVGIELANAVGSNGTTASSCTGKGETGIGLCGGGELCSAALAQGMNRAAAAENSRTDLT